MAGGLKDLGRARLFGTPTAGAALPSVIERLPNGDGFQYAIANYVSKGGDTLEGGGVVPDVVIPHSRASLLKGDAVLAAAIEWIKTQSE
jgi:carboxyl-terminal processing protease